jgi:hypothetical protein
MNSYNKKMKDAAGCNYKSVDFLSGRNMTWTSTPPEGQGIIRMGIKSKNFPSNMGSAVIAGTGGVALSAAAGPAI